MKPGNAHEPAGVQFDDRHANAQVGNEEAEGPVHGPHIIGDFLHDYMFLLSSGRHSRLWFIFKSIVKDALKS